MKVVIETSGEMPASEVQVGYVYPVRGGRNRHHRYIVLALPEPEPPHRRAIPSEMAICLIVDDEGVPRGATSFYKSYFDGLRPIAFVDGLENITLVMRDF